MQLIQNWGLEMCSDLKYSLDRWRELLRYRTGFWNLGELKSKSKEGAGIWGEG